MPELGQTTPGNVLRGSALEALAELANGRFEERMRLDAASRLLVVIKRVLLLRTAGQLPEPAPKPAQRRAVTEIERIAAAWNPIAITAGEFVNDLPPGDVRLLVELAPVWAGAAA